MMLTSSSPLDRLGQSRLRILFALTEVGLCLVCLPPIIGFDFQAASFWMALLAFPILSIALFFLFFQRQSVVLLSSKQPILVTTTTWFGKYTSTVEEKLEGAAWIQVSRNMPFDDNGSYTVEIVQPGCWATMLSSYELSKDGLELAKKRCTEIARFLGLKDIGYRG